MSGRQVAVKMAGALSDNPRENVESVRREAKLFWFLDHANIIKLKAVCVKEPNLCLVMEYARGGSVCQALNGRHLVPDVLLDWAKQVADGMHYLHEEAPMQLIHRDLKSSNSKNQAIVDHTSPARCALPSPLPGRYGTIPFAANALQCIVSGEKNPKIAPSPWDSVTLPEEDRATAVGNMHKNLVKIARVALEIYPRRQTDRHTYRRAHHSTSPPLPRAK